ncbi:MAG TPA: toll/interleukin-1 receptor domain-containing protein [Pyrinomonadaceae bacterium]|nr:toll/interleukin-1 receptor domain-containing protein [Pyrinomonadaceae bacterium]
MSDSPVPTRPYRLFFSHGGDDAYIVEQFLKPKVEGSGAVVFLDAGRIEYGDDFRELILDELAQFDELLVLLTQSSLRRPWVLAEVGAALIRGRRIVAITYGPTETELQQLGILSLIGNSSLLKLEDFDDYIEQLTGRVEAHNHG